MLFSAPYKDGVIYNADVDTAMLALDDEMNYVVKNPATGNLFYTKRNSKGRVLLYEQYLSEKGKKQVRQIKLDKFSSSIVHPTFSADGKIMVFSSNDEIGFGGYDLWYTELKGGKWNEPENLGQNINGVYNEFSPTISGDFLYFSTEGRSYSCGNFEIYATRLISTQTMFGDTVYQFPIGHSKVQRLPAPFNSQFNDFGFIVNEQNNACFWISQPDTNAGDRIYTFRGRPDCVAFDGTVSSYDDGFVIPYAKVTAQPVDVKASPFSVWADSTGHYRLYLQPGSTYKVTFSARNYLSNTETLTASRASEETVVSVQPYSPTLITFKRHYQHPYWCNVIFGSNGGADLTSRGKETIDPLIRFLRENTHLQLKITAVCSLHEASFDKMLNTARLQSLLEYMTSMGIPALEVKTATLETSWMTSPEAETVYNNAILFSFTEK